MRLLLITAFICASLSSFAQNWNSLNYSEHQYGLEKNPLKGFATMWDVESDFPYSIQGKLFKFSDIVKGPKNYDWALVDSFIAAEGRKGKHTYLQVNIDPVKNQQLDLPQDVLNDLNSKNEIVTITEIKGTDTNVLVSPNWNNQVLMDAMTDFIAAFGAKYDNDPRVFLVHVGLYGMWGEWHIFPFEANYSYLEMNTANKNKIANAYLSSFKNTQLLARYPASMPDPTKFGYSDGLFFEHSIGTPSWYFENLLNNDGAANNWKNLPIGGEVSPEIQDTLFLQWPNVTGNNVLFPHKNNVNYAMQDITASINATHSTWLFAHHLFQKPSTTKITQTEINNAIRTQKLLGYTFYAEKYSVFGVGGVPKMFVEISNKGVAPMYEDWDVEFAVLNSKEELQILNTKKLRMNQLLPNEQKIKRIKSQSQLIDGDYTVVLRLKNPLLAFSADAPPVRFANETQDLNLEGWLTLGKIKIQNGKISMLEDLQVKNPFGGKSIQIPGKIEAENYDLGGMGLSYFVNENRQGNAPNFRPSELVSIERKQTASNEFAVSHMSNGWMEYSITNPTEGDFDFTCNYFNAEQDALVHVFLGKKEITTFQGFTANGLPGEPNTLRIPNVFLPAGKKLELRFIFENCGNLEFDKFDITEAGRIKNGDYSIKSKNGSYLFAPNSQNINSSWTEKGDSTIWTFVHEGNEIYSIYSKKFNNHKIEIANASCAQGNLTSLTNASGTNSHQRWKIEQEGEYLMFYPAHCNTFALDIWAWNLPVVHVYWPNNQNDNQLFKLVPASNQAQLFQKINSSSNSKIKVYPNPVNNLLKVNIPNAHERNADIKISNIQGSILYAQKTSEELNYINTDQFSTSGLLLVQIVQDGIVQSFKVTKQ